MSKVWINKLVDTDTGEKITEKRNRAFDKINEKGYLFRGNSNKAVTFQDISLPEELSDSDVGKVYRLKEHIERNSNMLRIRKRDGYYPMQREHFEKVWGLQRRQTYNLLHKLMDLGVIAKVTVEVEYITSVQYYMNPLYFINGSRINPTLYNIFKEQLKPYFPKWVINQYEEGLNDAG